MLVTDLPTLRPDEYPAANCLRQEIRRAKDYAVSFPNSGARVTAFFAQLAGQSLPATQAIVANGAKVPATGSGAVATVVVANGVVTGVTFAAS